MRTLKLSILLISGYILFLNSYLYAQIDTLFWFAAPEVSISNQNFDRPILLRITTYFNPAVVTISQPAGGGMPTQVVNIPANSTQTINLTSWIDFIETKPANTILNYGLKIHSTAFISVYYEVQSIQCQCNPEIFVLKGKNALGTDFWIPHQTFLNNNSGYSPAPYASFDIVATEDNTQITIIPSNDVVGNTAGIPYIVTLNTGQVYSATAVSQSASQRLNGSRVTSNKPIAITIKDDLMYLSSCSDLGGDQIVPVNILGTKYAIVKGFLNIPDKIFVLATQNNTDIFINGGLVSTINQGQTYVYNLNASSAFLEASFPVYVLHMSGYGCEVGMSLLPSIECTGSSSVSIVRSTNESLFANIIVPNGYQGNFTVNGNPGVITPGDFTPIPGTSGQWLSAQITLPSTNYPQGLPILIQNSTSIFHLGMIHGGAGSGTRYGYFSNYAVVEANADANAQNYCEGDSISLFANFSVGATYLWTGPNNFSSTQQNPVIYNASTLMNGWYKLVLNVGINCSDSDSVYITVNPLPSTPTANDTSICEGTSATLSVQPQPNTQYAWYNQATGGNPLATGSSFSTPNLTNTTTYFVEAIQNGCTSIRRPVIVTTTKLVINDSTLSVCKGKNVSIQVELPSGFEVKWYDISGNFVSQDNPLFINSLSSDTVFLYEYVNQNCISNRAAVNIQVNPLPIPLFTVQPTKDTILSVQEAVYTFNNLSQGGMKYIWYFGNGDSLVTTDLLASVTYRYQQAGEYNVRLCVENPFGCIDCYQYGPLIVNNTFWLFIPNVFTPNQDGLNDEFKMVMVGIATAELWIYDRWGIEIFNTRNAKSQFWDGTKNGKTCPEGVYTYKLKAIAENGKSIMRFGTITLLR